ncbi:hypothetical protein CA54_30230 [Symmachiella macrocystis]|uniref:Uncharacterized protein n=1 Tax=Symmachiella macrocystis TaxID=2527985 RepID=A0A5C6BPN8_9PLAN|nr:hypothetical protein [Symmachiella macrocystis]TWU14180.1 hypothetical protein CA54_30230 [Symmachiella macrocystis]
MRNRIVNQRTTWMGLGLIFGVAVSYLWPHEPAQAITNSRAEKFEMITCPAATAGNEGVFVFDHITGQVRGAVLDPQAATFTAFYFRNVAQDFDLQNLGGKPQFAIVAGYAQLQNKPGVRVQTAPGIIYVAELTSGMVRSYAFSWERTTRQAALQELTPVSQFPFRQADVQ